MEIPEPSSYFKRGLAKIKQPRVITLSSLVILLSFFLYFQEDLLPKAEQSSYSASAPIQLSAFPLVVPTLKYGFALDTMHLQQQTIENGQFLADLLLNKELDYPTIEQLVKNAEGVFDVRKIRTGKPLSFLYRDSTQQADYMVYEPSVYEYVVFQLKDDLKVEKFEKEVETTVHAHAGVIESSLWNAMVDNGMSFELTSKMEDALQWSVDFHHLQKQDAFKLVYDQNYIEGEAVGVGQVYAAYYKNYDNEYHAIYFDNGKHQGYYDLEGRPMKSSFLKSPVKYSRISSYFNLNRFHPILKRRRPHLGTDYAAPYGTPIYAVGNGVVTKASYTKGNGRFVKIKHDDTYETQYLHMQKFAQGIRPGVHVKQGQVIGYVGSTGLATGPHVCFRFWKNGRQVNHLKLNFPPPEPLPEADLPAFYKVRDEYMAQLDGLEFKQPIAQKESEDNEKGNP